MSKKVKIEKAAKVETAESKPKVVKESKPAEETKIETKSKTETKKERNEYGHSEGTQSATIDAMLKKGSDLDTIAKKIGSSRGRVRSHIRHLEVSHGAKCKVSKDGVHKLEV